VKANQRESLRPKFRRLTIVGGNRQLKGKNLCKTYERLVGSSTMQTELRLTGSRSPVGSVQAGCRLANTPNVPLPAARELGRKRLHPLQGTLSLSDAFGCLGDKEISL